VRIFFWQEAVRQTAIAIGARAQAVARIMSARRCKAVSIEGEATGRQHIGGGVCFLGSLGKFCFFHLFIFFCHHWLTQRTGVAFKSEERTRKAVIQSDMCVRVCVCVGRGVLCD